MKLKRSLAIVLALLMVLPLAACSKAAEPGENTGATTTAEPKATTTTTVEAPIDGDPTTTVPGATETTATDESGNPVTTTTVTDASGNPVTQPTNSQTPGATTTRTTRTNRPGQTQQSHSISEQITIKKGTTPLEKGLNFGGKEYRYAVWGTEIDDRMKTQNSGFEKAYNVKLKLDMLPTNEYVAGLASALAAGKPYDILFFYNFQYPEQITANVMQPLDDYITTADLWGKNSATTGGFSLSLSQALSMNGHVYAVGGAYLQGPTVIWYNKKEFSKAGYTGAKDPLAMYKAGNWSWQKLYDMLSVIQKPAQGIYGINSIAPYYHAQFICSFNTDLAKLTSDGKLKENLSDSKLYEAFEMLQKFCYGEHKVANPTDIYVNGAEQFLNGTTVSLVGTMGYYGTFNRKVPTATAFDQSLNNLGMVPMPTYGKNGPNVIWDWMGYGAGAGASKEGVLCALAYAKYDSIHNHLNAYTDTMPTEFKQISCGILDKDNLIAPKNGFKSSAGDMGDINSKIGTAIAINGQKTTVVLKSYKKTVQNIIDTALKG